MKKQISNSFSFAEDALQLRAQLHAGAERVPLLRDYRQQQETLLKQAYLAHEPLHLLLECRSSLVDMLLSVLWEHINHDSIDICFIAAGGYGRKELLPYSDIDLFILLPEPKPNTANIETFIAELWDIGLKVSHNVCTVKECQALAKEDLALITSLLECRFLLGNSTLFAALQAAIAPTQMWNSQEFLLAKQEEQARRYLKYGGSSYNLEPNVKEGPGGLRDIQTILWIGNRHFSQQDNKQFVVMTLLTPQEVHTLQQGQLFLWNIRCALHYLARRKEERLLFDHQVKLAKQFGYVDKENELAIEQFMKNYYRTVKSLNELNDMLVQLLQETILYSAHTETLVVLNERFQVRNNYIEVTHPEVFSYTPSALLELFSLMADHPEVKGVRANTIRLIHQHHHLINDAFRKNPDNHRWLLALLNSKSNVAKQLKRMDRYGLLGRLIPDFASIIGQMQYDLFHVYTVDQHLLAVVDQVYQLTADSEKFPLATKILPALPNLSLLYLAALFHDMGKGKGGDHSQLGEHIVQRFCEDNSFSDEETALLTWLVAHHLLMSNTAQQQDIYDPEVVASFAKEVGSEQRLNYLYLLTVADICGTNPTLWNSWKDTLLKNLYHATEQLLKTQEHTASSIADIKYRALQQLNLSSMAQENVLTLWEQWGQFYFRRTRLDSIVRHTQAILNKENRLKPLVLIANEDALGATELFIYMPGQDYHVAITTVVLDRLDMNIVEAHITTTKDGYKLDSYYIMTKSGKLLTDQHDIDLLKTTLEQQLSKKLSRPTLTPRKLSQRQKHFNYPTKITFHLDALRQRTNMTLITPDRPGLLARVCMALVDCKVILQGAKIATLGERVEDVFFLTDHHQQPLTEDASQSLKQRICYYLEQMSPSQPS